MAKATNRGIVILYQGQSLTKNVEEAILKIIAPFTYGNEGKADVFQLNANDLALAAAGQVQRSKLIYFNVKSDTPEVKAADLIGITFEKQLKDEDPILLVMRISSAINAAKNDVSDGSIALIRALKIAAKPGFSFSVGSEILEKYHLTSQALEIIRRVLTANNIPYE
jgi:acetylglutamate kinase